MVSQNEQFSPETRKKSAAAKYYIVEYYWNLLTYLEKRKERMNRLRDFIQKGNFIH
jgi:hypothetical protein